MTSCQNERSQLQNKNRAMQILAVKLMELRREEEKAKVAEIERGAATDRSEAIESLLRCVERLPDKLRRQVDWLNAHPEHDMVFGWVEQFYDAEPRRTLPPMRGYFAGTMLIRRQRLLAAGEFPSQYRVGEFIDWYVRAQELGFLDASPD